LKKDDEVAADQKLTFNLRNCVLMRSGEKEVLVFLMMATEKMIPMLHMDFKVTI